MVEAPSYDTQQIHAQAETTLARNERKSNRQKTHRIDFTRVGEIVLIHVLILQIRGRLRLNRTLPLPQADRGTTAATALQHGQIGVPAEQHKTKKIKTRNTSHNKGKTRNSSHKKEKTRNTSHITVSRHSDAAFVSPYPGLAGTCAIQRSRGESAEPPRL